MKKICVAAMLIVGVLMTMQSVAEPAARSYFNSGTSRMTPFDHSEGVWCERGTPRHLCARITDSSGSGVCKGYTIGGGVDFGFKILSFLKVVFAPSGAFSHRFCNTRSESHSCAGTPGKKTYVQLFTLDYWSGVEFSPVKRTSRLMARRCADSNGCRGANRSFLREFGAACTSNEEERVHRRSAGTRQFRYTYNEHRCIRKSVVRSDMWYTSERLTRCIRRNFNQPPPR